jgi:hypothetical protein
MNVGYTRTEEHIMSRRQSITQTSDDSCIASVCETGGGKRERKKKKIETGSHGLEKERPQTKELACGKENEGGMVDC